MALESASVSATADHRKPYGGVHPDALPTRPLHTQNEYSDRLSEVVEIYKLSGDYCSMLKVRAASMEHLEGAMDRISRHGEMRTLTVVSTQCADSPVEPPREEAPPPSPPDGWSVPKPARPRGPP